MIKLFINCSCIAISTITFHKAPVLNKRLSNKLMCLCNMCHYILLGILDMHTDDLRVREGHCDLLIAHVLHTGVLLSVARSRRTSPVISLNQFIHCMNGSNYKKRNPHYT